MINKIFLEGLKSVIMKSLTSPSEQKGSEPLSIVFLGALLGITLILAQVFFGLSFYRVLQLDKNYGEGLSMLLTALMYIVQAAICTLLVRHRLKKMTKENVVVKEYKLLKGVVNALIEGYKSK